MGGALALGKAPGGRCRPCWQPPPSWGELTAEGQLLLPPRPPFPQGSGPWFLI